jgi:hypothetical protein
MTYGKSVIIAHEKHGTFGYTSALELLDQRVVREPYWYAGDALTRAKEILASQDEDAAWRFLSSRRDYEYEYVEKQELGQ